jgi:hypothetical protein
VRRSPAVVVRVRAAWDEGGGGPSRAALPPLWCGSVRLGMREVAGLRAPLSRRWPPAETAVLITPVNDRASPPGRRAVYWRKMAGPWLSGEPTCASRHMISPAVPPGETAVLIMRRLARLGWDSVPKSSRNAPVNDRASWTAGERRASPGQRPSSQAALTCSMDGGRAAPVPGQRRSSPAALTCTTTAGQRAHAVTRTNNGGTARPESAAARAGPPQWRRCRGVVMTVRKPNRTSAQARKMVARIVADSPRSIWVLPRPRRS